MSRYARQMMVPGVGIAGQARLRAARVLVVGAGGLGCPVLTYLVAAGIGKVTLIDPDVVSLGNLHRQPLYTVGDIGAAKALAAKSRLKAQNPEVEIEALVAALDPANVSRLVDQADLVIDAADSFAVSYTLSDACLIRQKPLISASVLGQSGYVGGFCAGAPSLRAVFPDLPDSSQTCATAGVMGPVVGLLGAMQAQLAMQVLIGSESGPMGKLTTVDFVSQHFGGFRFQDAPEPDTWFAFVAASQVLPSDFVVELRGLDEAPTPAVTQAVRLSGEAVCDLPLSGEQRVVLCCKTGLRAWHAAKLLEKRGQGNIVLLAAGGEQ